MAERRYSFRFSLPEGCVMAVGFLLTSFLVFLFGVYVGKEVEAHKAVQQARTMRLPVSASVESPPSRSAADPSGRIPASPVEKPVTIPPPSNALASTVPPEPRQTSRPTEANAPPASPSTTTQVATGGQNKPTPSFSPSPPPSAVSSTPAAPPAAGVSASSTPGVSVASKPTPQTSSPKSPSFIVSPAPRSQPASSSPNMDTAASASPRESASVPLGAEFSDVRVPAAEPPPVPKEKKVQVPSGRWVVQVQATTQEEAAQNLAKQLREQGLAPVVSKVERQGEVWYRVRVGKFANEDEARAVVTRFRREGKFSQAYPVLE